MPSVCGGTCLLEGGEGGSRPQPPPASSNGITDSDNDMVEISEEDEEPELVAPPSLILSDEISGSEPDSEAMDTG